MEEEHSTESADIFAAQESWSLNQEDIELIVREIFDKLHIERPTSVKFVMEPIETDSKPSASTKKGTITIHAASEVEARKVICQQAIKQKWSWKKWTLANRIGLSALIACGFYLLLFFTGLTIRWFLPDNLKIVGDIFTGLLLLVPLYPMIRMPVWSEYARRELQEYLIETNGIAEYDAEYCYLGYSIIIGFGYLCMWIIGGLFILTTISSGLDVSLLLILSMLVVLLAIFIPMARDSRDKKNYDRCVEYEKLNIFNDENPQGMNTPEAAELGQTALELAQKLELEGFTHEETGENLPVEIAFHKTPFPHCRNCDYVFEEERILFDIRDMNIDSAKRLLASILIQRHIIMIRPLRIVIGVLLSGLLGPPIAYLLSMFNVPFALVSAMILLMLFVVFNNKIMIIDANIRDTVDTTLERTGLYSPRLLAIYSGITFSLSRKFQLQFAVGVLIFYVLVIGTLLIFA